MRPAPDCMAWLLVPMSTLAIWAYCRLIGWLMAIPCPRHPEPPPLGQKQKLVAKAPQRPTQSKKADASSSRDMGKTTYHIHCMTPIPRRGRAVHFHRLVGWTRLIFSPNGPRRRLLPKGLWKGKN
jgi:hypothetical protein